MKAKKMIIIVTCVLLGASILMVGCKEKKQANNPKESQTFKSELETTEEELKGYGDVDPEFKKLKNYVEKKLSKYNSWVATTTKGKVYINCDSEGYGNSLVYVAEGKRIYLRLTAPVMPADYDAQKKEVQAHIFDEGTDYDGATYLMRISDTEIELMYESEYQRYDNRIPSELRNIVFKRQKDKCILAVQSYLRKNLDKDFTLYNLMYKKIKTDDNSYKVVVTGLKEKNEGQDRKYRLDLQAKKTEKGYEITEWSR